MNRPEGKLSYPQAEIGATNLLLNRAHDHGRAGIYTGITSPNRGRKYSGLAFPWDANQVILVWARDGSNESLAAGMTETSVLYEGQDESGIVYNQRRLYGKARAEGLVTGS